MRTRKQAAQHKEESDISVSVGITSGCLCFVCALELPTICL